jgi:DNA-binding transcriptional LysR family regulator
VTQRSFRLDRQARGGIGGKLFLRSSKSVSLTPSGRRFQTTAEEILDACTRVKAELQATAADRPLRIGVLRTLPSAHLAKLVETLQKTLVQNAPRTCR